MSARVPHRNQRVTGGNGVIGRWLAWGLVALGAVLAGRDAYAFLETGARSLTALGQLWYALHPGSLNLIQAVVERYIHPFLWDPVIFSVLRLPASLVFLAPGVAYLVLRRKRGRRRRGAFN
jgi:hypothetical protein